MFSPKDACRILNVPLLAADSARLVSEATLDSRKVKPGSLFVALRGASQDGHDYLEEAFNRQAAAALIRSDYSEFNQSKIASSDSRWKNLIPVDNVELALRRLASWRRELYVQPVIGVTGSVGKTSTKEMLGYLLAKRFKGLTGSGNFNNELGLPLNLMALDPLHDFCLAEVGASKPGDIRFLCDILRPTYAMITQVSAAHLEGFGSLEAIYRTKLELAESLPTGSVCLLPDFDAALIEKAKRLERKWILVGTTEAADYRLTDVRQDGIEVVFTLAGRKTFRVPAGAPFFAQNAAMAAAMADQLGFALEDQPAEWTDFNLPPGRFECRRVGDDITLVYDGYNASPESFRRSIEGFSQMRVSGRKMVLFADMLELGPEEERFHGEIGKKLGESDFDFIGAYGQRAIRALENVRRAAARTEVLEFESAEDAGNYFGGMLRKGDALLLKASRGMRMDKALNLIETMIAESFRLKCR